MPETVRVVRNIFRALCRTQSSSWFNREAKWRISDRVYETWSILIGSNWVPLEEKEVENFFLASAVNVRLSDRRKVFYLPPMAEEPEFVPVLSLEYSSDRNSISDIKLRVMLVCSKRDEDGLCGIGFRMEEGQNIHGFYHSQLTKTLEGAGQAEIGPVIECPDCIPMTQPSFPLKAVDPITLLLCLLVSLYGLEYCWSLISEYDPIELKPYLEYIIRSERFTAS